MMHIRGMKKVLYLLVLGFLGSSGYLSAQCDTNLVTEKGVISDIKTEGKDSAHFAFDGDHSTFWGSQDANSLKYGLPGALALNGIIIHFANNRIPADFKLNKSLDGSNWSPLLISNGIYTRGADSIVYYFGAENIRFLQVEFTATKDKAFNIAEIELLQTNCDPKEMKNQVIDFKRIADAYTQVGKFDLDATGVPDGSVSFRVLEGSATMSGNSLSTNGYRGTVVVEAEIAAKDGYYAAYATQLFTLYDEMDYQPVNRMNLTSDYPLEFDSWQTYPIYVGAAFNDPLNEYELSRQELFIDGEEVDLVQEANYQYYMWSPTAYADYEVKLVSYASNGTSTTTTETVTVVKGANSQQTTTLKDVVIWFGRENSRSFEGSYTLPQHVGVYDEITAHLDVECPDNNCDDWDRWAYIDIQAPDGNWIQLIRYITPYGVACDHSIDITPYASLLQGNVNLRVFIDTWGTGGWQLTLDLDFQAGTPEYFYSRIDEIWDGTYDFGNPANLQPVDTVKYTIPEEAEEADLILSTTGHGWGENNTSNAAEFFNALHNINLNGQSAYQQNLWNTCNPNPDACTGQRGTWQYNRAGWCPGAISVPEVYPLKGLLKGDSFELTYQFHTAYVDKCHPNSPDCRSGSTCPNCNAGYNPHYQIDGHIVSYSKRPIAYSGQYYTGIDNGDIELSFGLYPNPSNGFFRVTDLNTPEPVKLIIKSIDGKAQAVYYFDNGNQLSGLNISTASLASGLYFVQIQGEGISGYKSLVVD